MVVAKACRSALLALYGLASMDQRPLPQFFGACEIAAFTNSVYATMALGANKSLLRR